MLEPTTPLVWNWHISCIADHIQAVLEDWMAKQADPTFHQRIQNLLINVPPGTAKSRITSVFTPAWMWTRCPEWRAIFLSANPRVALRDSVYCRDVIESDWYRDLFSPTWRLAEDQNAKGLFRNTRGGYRQAMGFAARITGDRADCLPGETLVSTEHGPMPIAAIYSASRFPRVWSYNSATRRVELKEVKAARKLLGKPLVRIALENGNSIKCTHDHRIWTDRGYRQAGSLGPGAVAGSLRVRTGDHVTRFQAVPQVLVRVSQGDRLPEVCRLRQGLREATVRRDEGHEGGTSAGILLATVRGCDEQPQTQSGSLPLSDLREGDARGQWQEILLEGVHPPATHAGTSLRPLRVDVSAAQPPHRVLRTQVCQCGACGEYGRGGEFPLHQGNESGALVPDDATACPPEGRQPLCRLRATRSDLRHRDRAGQIELVDPPYRPRHAEQHAGEPDHALPTLPQAAPQLERVAVSLVERLGDRPDFVYDIQVEGNRNFFAGEILVHNCLMVDDPHDAEEVNSDASRNGVRDRWNGAIANRVNDLRSSVRIGIMQRVHSEDWSGLVLESGGWEHLCLPMEFEPDRACTTAIGWSDPRTQPGELLFPERFPPRVLEQERARLGSYGYAGQHQQRPAPRDGGMFKRAWFSVVDAVPVGVDRVRAYDLAATPDGDYTVGSKLARTHDGMFYVEDVVRGRWTPHERDAVILQTAQADGKSVPIWVEQEPGSAGVSVIASLVRMLAGFTIHGERATGDKVTRASSFAAQCEAGNVKLLKGEWNRDWLDELTIFPNGKFDDQVDATSLAFNQLADGHHRWGFHLSPKK